MAAIDLFNPVAADTEDLDSPEARLRLTEKILGAFSYAYAIGARDVAGRLHAVLAEIEAAVEVSPSKRPGGGALKQAELWVAYVEARNGYHVACRNGRDSGKVLSALEAMKDAYKRWSFS